MRTVMRWVRQTARRLPWSRGYRGQVFEQHTHAEVIQYEVARELLGDRLGEALARADSATDPAERDRWEQVASDAERARQTLRVGSVEAATLVREATQARAAAQPTV